MVNNPVMLIDPDGRKVYDSPIMEWSAGLTEDSFMNMNGYNRRDFNRRGGTGGGGSSSGTNGNYNNASASGDYTGFWNSVLKLYGMQLTSNGVYNTAYSPLTKSIFSSFFTPNTDIGKQFEKMVISSWLSNGISLIDVPDKIWKSNGLNRSPDGFYFSNGIEANIQIGGRSQTKAHLMKETILEATASFKSNIDGKNGGQLFDYVNYLSKRGSNNNLMLVTTADVTDARNLINYGSDRDVNVFHIIPFYRQSGNNIEINFRQVLYINSWFGDFQGYSTMDLLVNPYIRQNYGK